jgi:hypothetical protein
MALSRASHTKYEERAALLRLAGMWIDAATTAEDAECPRHGVA